MRIVISLANPTLTYCSFDLSPSHSSPSWKLLTTSLPREAYLNSVPFPGEFLFLLLLLLRLEWIGICSLQSGPNSCVCFKTATSVTWPNDSSNRKAQAHSFHWMTELQRLERNFWRSSSPSPCLIRFPTVGSAPGILHYGLDLGFECSCCAPWVPHFNTAEEEHLAAMQQAAPSLSHLLRRRCQLLLTHHNRDRRENPGEIPYILTVKTSDAACIHMDLPLPHQKNQCNATAEDDTFEYFPWNWDIS